MIKQSFPYGEYKGKKLFLKRITKTKAKILLKNNKTIFIGKGGFYVDLTYDFLLNNYRGYMYLDNEKFIKLSLECFINEYEFYNGNYIKGIVKFFEIRTEDEYNHDSLYKR